MFLWQGIRYGDKPYTYLVITHTQESTILTLHCCKLRKNETKDIIKFQSKVITLFILTN